ncbi:sigma-70 family RNA polymerase sigma factor, partial [Helcococcus bovis]|uniref:sigma-70 family RNA polymerase sigma factor n=1 Tax=Helcococcus bovis TaxID=3153252 RepID=UPI0038BB44A9
KTKKYCIKIIRNCSIDIYNKNKFEQCKDFTIDNINNEYNDEYSREIFDNIYSILLQIPEKYSKIIIMKIEGYSYLEISNKTGKNIQNVRQIYSRGRKMILKKLNNYNKKL